MLLDSSEDEVPGEQLGESERKDKRKLYQEETKLTTKLSAANKFSAFQKSDKSKFGLIVFLTITLSITSYFLLADLHPYFEICFLTENFVFEYIKQLVSMSKSMNFVIRKDSFEKLNLDGFKVEQVHKSILEELFLFNTARKNVKL